MKIALTVWGKWISPVFDSAQTILVADIENGTIKSRNHLTFDAEQPVLLAKLLKKLDVSLFICGAITEYPAKILENETLRLIPFITGMAESILETLALDKPIVPIYLMPGCRIRKLIQCHNGKGKGHPVGKNCRNRNNGL